jgi:hypothetical protein
MLKFWKKAILTNLAVILTILVSLTLFFMTPWGKPMFKATLLLPEVSPEIPFHPLRIFSKPPIIEEVEIPVNDKKIKADLYRPKDNKKHPGIIVALGTDVTRKNAELIPVARALSRLDYVVLVPDLPDFIAGFVWTDSSEILVSSYSFLENQRFIEKEKMGFLGFCVGGAQAIVAAEDQRISERVSTIVALTPYFNFYTLSEEILAGNVKGEYGIEATIKSLQKGFLNYVSDKQEKQLLIDHFLDGKELSSEEINKLSVEAKNIYSFLSNKDKSNFGILWENLPTKGKELLTNLSPDAKISNLKAKLFIVYDKGYTFIPKSQADYWKDIASSHKISISVIQSLEHVKVKPRLPRWELTKLGFQLFIFMSKVLSVIS